MYFQHTAGIQVICIPTVCSIYRVKYRFSVCQKYGQYTGYLYAGCIFKIQISCMPKLQQNKYILHVFFCCMSGIQQSKPRVCDNTIPQICRIQFLLGGLGRPTDKWGVGTQHTYHVFEVRTFVPPSIICTTNTDTKRTLGHCANANEIEYGCPSAEKLHTYIYIGAYCYI